MYSCHPMCPPPPCTRRCVGEIVTKRRLYETRCYDEVKVCEFCGFEYPHMHPGCPRCGGQMYGPGMFMYHHMMY